jgi:RNA polymerase sigma-70 factor, ECF subfamily
VHIPRPPWEGHWQTGKKTAPSQPFFLVSLSIVAMSVQSGAENRLNEVNFERLVDAEARRLYRLALAIVDDPAEAEDAVQDTMVIAWRRWSSLQDLSNPSAWLTRVCVRECIRQRRLLRRTPVVTGGSSFAEGQFQFPDIGERLIDLHRAYQHLSARQRAMVTLHHHDGFTVDECAAFLGCRPGTARSHLGRAMAKLRRELGDA